MASAVLAFAAVWLGGLNQDEGWYLYAANLVSEGEMPLRDFFFTQGPVFPILYAPFSFLWKTFGLLGGRLFTLLLGVIGILFAVATARRLAPEEHRNEAALVTFFLLGVNLYHLYYLAIPKTYALAALFVLVGFYLMTFPRWAALAGLPFAFAAATRVSLGAILPVGFVYLLLFRRQIKSAIVFGFLAAGAFALVYGPILLNAFPAFLASLGYHSARGGSDLTWVVGSLSRLVRWYLPVFIVLGLSLSRSRPRALVLLFGFLSVFAAQMLAPFPYEDYQVPVMALLAIFAAVNYAGKVKAEGQVQQRTGLLLVLGLTFACSFGSPLLEKWMTNGQDRFWSLKKSAPELKQLQEVARRIEALDPGGKELLTEDLYLAIETNRKVPHGFEMGPFSFWGEKLPYRSTRRVAFDDKTLREYLASASTPVAALSGYTFAITVPECTETDILRQLDYMSILKKNYNFVENVAFFGQNATTLVILKHK